MDMSDTGSLDAPALGGAFLLEPCGSRRGFVPEELSGESLEMLAAAREFMAGEVLSRTDEIDSLPDGLMPALLRKAGELGFLAIDVPEAYDGLGLDKTTSVLLDEAWSCQSSFSVSRGAHCGIGSLPVVFFGTEAQKQRYLPRLATGEILAAYALSEPGSGSDALGARTKAVLSDDGTEWILNGTKQFITNAGFADLIVVFAKVDGSQFTAFLVESTDPGVSTGAEEQKMGQKGSSTRQVILEDARIPKDRLLHQIGKGHQVAFNILNIGRLKLGSSVLGGAKLLLEKTIEYCKERKQFDTPIIRFGAMRKKVADMAARAYATEALAYRLAGYLDERLAKLDGDDPDHNRHALQAIEEYAAETAIMKVFGTDTCRLITDECFQMHGGYGYLREYPAERAYRDERVNRIYEGTNEINRLLIPGTLMKRATRGRLALMPWIESVQAEAARPATLPSGDAPLVVETALADQAKKLVGLLSGAAAMRHGDAIEQQQELMLALADITIDACTMDYATTRAQAAVDAGRADAAFHVACATYYVHTSWDRAAASARRLACSLDGGDGRLLAAIDNLSPRSNADVIAAGKVISDAVVEKGGYKPY
jgi:alkylation response protein AidB-like acyl-CoA dehydrogenase